LGKGAWEQRAAKAESSQHAQEEDDVGCCPKENSSSAASAMGEGKSCPQEVSVGRTTQFEMGKFSPIKQHGDCEYIGNPSTAYGRRRRNWIDARA
jgi:hypothetical protein